MPNNIVAFEDLKRAVEITACSRFQASLRLSARHRQSSYVISILSTFVIMLSLIPNFDELTEHQNQILLACSIVISVFIIFTSLLDSSGNYLHRAESIHQSARGVSTVFHNLKTLDPEALNFADKLNNERDRYKKVLEDCPFNHERVDYIYAKLERPNLFPDYYSNNGFIYFLQRFGDNLSYYIRFNAWLIPHIVVVIGAIYVVGRYIL